VIFDAPQGDEGFEKRLAFAKNWFKHHPNPHVEIIHQEICRNQAHRRLLALSLHLNTMD